MAIKDNNSNSKHSNNEDFFCTEHLQINLKDRAVKSTVITITAQAIKLVLQLVFMALLARLLSPNDFGLFAMVFVFTGLGLILMEGGLSMATIQRENISHAQVSNLFWLNILLGVVIAILAILISPLVAWVYDEPQLNTIMIIMSLSFIIGSFYVQHDAILKRQMRFKELVIIDVISIFIGGLFGVLAAYKGLGYWALVVMQIATTTIKVLMIWFMVKWRPSFFARGVGTKPLVNFGANLTGANFVGYFTDNATPFSIGLIGGAHFLGLYDRSFILASIPSKKLLPPIMSVLQSAVSRVAQDTERLKRVSISLMSKVALITMLFSSMLFVSADWIVLILLGETWSDAIPVLQVIILGLIATPIASLIAVILTSLGKGNVLFKAKLISLSILIVSIFIGSFWGVWGVLIATSVSSLLIRLPAFLIYAAKHQPIESKDFLTILSKPMFITIVTLALCELLKLYYQPEYKIIGFFIYLFFVSSLFITLCFIFKETREDIHETLNLIKSIALKQGHSHATK